MLSFKRIINTAILCIMLISIIFNLEIKATFSNILEDPNIYYTTMELLCIEGYPAQEHKVITDDGYILTLHRIPNSRKRPKVERKSNHFTKIHKNWHSDFKNCIEESKNETATGLPVLMVHGILMASDGWLLQGPKYDMAYILSDAGYDVWLFNVRGNFYSRAHKYLKPSSHKYWDFSHHENSIYDIPATIDYILKKTNHKKIFYVGYSMGGSIFFTSMAIRPEYSNKVLGFVGLAPFVFVKYKNVNLRRKLLYKDVLKTVEILEKKHVDEVLPKTDTSVRLAMRYCSPNSKFKNICYNILSHLMGSDTKLIAQDKLHLILSHMPAGSSMKTFTHYASNVRNNECKQFDYGVKKNMEKYGSPIPPDYPIWNVTVPVALYYSSGDFFSDLKDYEYLESMLSNVIAVRREKIFNHADYVWSFLAKDIIYYPALGVINNLRDKYYAESLNKIP